MDLSDNATESSQAELLLGLIARTRTAKDAIEADFIALNDTHLLSDYRQAVLWCKGRGVIGLSGVASVERNAPYALWMDKVCASLRADIPVSVSAATLPEGISREWLDWLPAHGLWIPFSVPGKSAACGGLFLAREVPWLRSDIARLSEWIGAWAAVRNNLQPFEPPRRIADLVDRLRHRPRRMQMLIGAALLIPLFPVHLSVLAPGELVPADPVPIRAPIDGVVSQFLVRPNQAVKAGEALFMFDSLQISSKLEVAEQALRTAEAELRQYDQQSLTDLKARAALATARGNVVERTAEVELLQRQRQRATVVAPYDGVAIFDDPQEWIGKPANTGDRIMRLAAAQASEIEAWVPVGDAIPLGSSGSARLYLSSSPLSPVDGTVYFQSYEAARRPDGNYAFRVRARLEESTGHRIGLKGTVRLRGGRVPMIYWIFRRPLASVREFLGI